MKPSNILHRPTGEAVLVDFGLSRHAQLPDLMEEEFRLPYGTAPYMAPEQVMGVRTDPRSDLFALGAMLYFFTTGIRPFGDPQRLSGLKRRLWRDPAPPRRLRPDCPPWLQEVILRCLEVLPERRHPTAAAARLRPPPPGRGAAHPARRQAAAGRLAEVLRRRFHPDAQPRFQRRRRDPAAQVATAPILAVAVDLSEQPPALAEALRAAVSRILATLPGARVACLNVLRTNRVMLDTTLDAEGRNKHAQRLAELRHWADPLQLPEGRATFHVLEAVSPAAALLEYANANRVDHIVLGARSVATRCQRSARQRLRRGRGGSLLHRDRGRRAPGGHGGRFLMAQSGPPCTSAAATTCAVDCPVPASPANTSASPTPVCQDRRRTTASLAAWLARRARFVAAHPGADEPAVRRRLESEYATLRRAQRPRAARSRMAVVRARSCGIRSP